jgi:hypothetical protein
MNPAGNYGYALEAQCDEHEGHADDHVDHEVVGGRHDGEGHRDRHGHGERPQRPVAAGAEDGDPGGEVPARMEARHRGVLVHERGREDLPVAGGALGDGVQQRQAGQPRGRHREEREHEQTQRPGEQADVAQRVVLLAAIAVEQKARADQHRPVPVDVDRVDHVL